MIFEKFSRFLWAFINLPQEPKLVDFSKRMTQLSVLQLSEPDIFHFIQLILKRLIFKRARVYNKAPAFMNWRFCVEDIVEGHISFGGGSCQVDRVAYRGI